MTPDIIGKIPKTPATYDEQGEQLTQTEWLDGFHVNFPQEVPELSEYKMSPQPETPYRVYAGGIQPVCYRFNTQAEWGQVNPFKVRA